MAKLRANRLYLLDDNLEIAGSEPVGPLSEKVVFHTDRFYRLYPTHRKDDDAPHVDFFINSDGVPMAQFSFCEEASPSQMSKFWDYLHRMVVIDEMSDRWGSVWLEWGGPGTRTSSLDNTMTVYFDGDIAFSYFALSNADERTYEEVLADYAYLKHLFDVSQSACTAD